MADERISLAEATELEAAARTAGLTQIQLEELHRQAFFLVLGDEVNIPPSDLSAIRRRELLSLARALGAGSVVDVIAPLVEADQAAAAKPPGTGYLKGWRIGLDPADSEDLAHLRDLVDRHDGSIARNLTKTVRFVATTTAGSAMQAKARALGIPVISAQDAARRFDEAIRTADLAAFENREAQAHWEVERAPNAIGTGATHGDGTNTPLRPTGDPATDLLVRAGAAGE